jgi:ATP-binding cassette subfamily B (MDR/TAP) protein 1
VFIYIATVGFYYTGERIVRKLRRAYLTSIIRQNMAFFDVLGPGEVTARITSGINLIHEGITSKLALSITASATFVAAFVIAFVEYWKLALILTSVIAAMSATGTLGAKFAIQYTKRSLESYGSGAAVAEEAIGSIRHVVAFGIQEQLAQKYLKFVLIAEKVRRHLSFQISLETNYNAL